MKNDTTTNSINPQGTEDILAFWRHCAHVDIVTKPLAIVPSNTVKVPLNTGRASPPPSCAPIALVAGSPIKYGAPVISVPYQQALNVQNIRGGLRPVGTPPFAWWMRCLSRLTASSPIHKRIPSITAQSLWLASCLAGFRLGRSLRPTAGGFSPTNSTLRVDAHGDGSARTITNVPTAHHHHHHHHHTVLSNEDPLSVSSSSCRRLSMSPWYDAIAPLMCSTLQYPLESPFLPSNAMHYPFLHGYSAAQLREASQRTDQHLQLLYRVTRYYAKRRGIPLEWVPRKPMLSAAYFTVLYRSMVLPINGTPSAPGDLSELLDAAAPDLPLLPSLIPVIELIRPISVMKRVLRSPPHDAGKQRAGAGSGVIMNETTKEKKEEEVEQEEIPNCTLYTCQQSDFLSPTSRRRMVLAPTSSVFSSRRVVVCAARDISAGEELTLGF